MKVTYLLIKSGSLSERRSQMWTYMSRFILIVFLISFLLGSNPVKEIRDARDAAEKTNRGTKMVLEKVKDR